MRFSENMSGLSDFLTEFVVLSVQSTDTNTNLQIHKAHKDVIIKVRK